MNNARLEREAAVMRVRWRERASLRMLASSKRVRSDLRRGGVSLLCDTGLHLLTMTGIPGTELMFGHGRLCARIPFFPDTRNTSSANHICSLRADFGSVFHVIDLVPVPWNELANSKILLINNDFSTRQEQIVMECTQRLKSSERRQEQIVEWTQRLESSERIFRR